ncbi:MAG: hypothetical protein R3C44_17880 [Chloroflexota bacterium]
MPEPVASTQLLCRQCAAVLPVTQGSSFTTCEYCGTVNYLDKSEAVLHYVVRPILNEAEAGTALKRWMAGNDTVKGLDTDAHILDQTYELFPLWLVRTRQPSGEHVYFKPAAALASANLGKLELPAGSLVAYDPEMDSAAVQPTVPLTAVRAWLADNEGIDPGQITETSLVHIPFYQFRYEYAGDRYVVRINAASGDVLAAVFPQKNETPYMAVGGLGCLAYFVAALIPGIAYLIGDTNGLLIGLIIYLVVAVVLAIPVFAAAANTSRRY